MFPVDLDAGWAPVPDSSGVSAKPLSGDFDEAAARGFRTRYVRFEAGGETHAPSIHAYWEEALLVEGSLTAKEDGRTLQAPSYVIRPPATPHGPFLSRGGCLLIEVQYFAARTVGLSTHLDRQAPRSR